MVGSGMSVPSPRAFEATAHSRARSRAIGRTARPYAILQVTTGGSDFTVGEALNADGNRKVAERWRPSAISAMMFLVHAWLLSPRRLPHAYLSQSRIA